MSIKEIREAALKLRESGSGHSTSPGPFDTWSESEATIKKKKKSADGEIKLPGKYELLDDFFNGLDSSIRLLQLKRSASQCWIFCWCCCSGKERLIVFRISLIYLKGLVTSVVVIGPPADWVKINVRQTKDCFEVYALVPGLLHEEVRVQSDPAGRLVITDQPKQVDNPWGITPFLRCEFNQIPLDV